MNPLLVILIFLGGIIAWFLLAPMFTLIGKIINKFICNAKREMFEEESEKEKENEECEKDF